MRPFFSIVIPTYNRAHLLSQTIRSVLDQRYKQFELIVVDDGSKDHTGEVVASLIAGNEDSISYVKQANSERGAARNTGLKKAKGDYVLFFDSDDTLYPNHLEVAAAYIEKADRPEFIHLRYDIKNAQGRITGEGPSFANPPNRELIFGNFLSCNGVFIRKDIALQHPFNEDRALAAMEDWELWLRLACRYQLHYVNEITSSIINHEARSVVSTNKDALIRRAEAMIRYATSDPEVVRYYEKDLPAFRSSCYSYVSLHLSLTGKHRKDTLKYLVKSFRFPGSLVQRRFYAILKHLI